MAHREKPSRRNRYIEKTKLRADCDAIRRKEILYARWFENQQANSFKAHHQLVSAKARGLLWQNPNFRKRTCSDFRETRSFQRCTNRDSPGAVYQNMLNLCASPNVSKVETSGSVKQRKVACVIAGGVRPPCGKSAASTIPTASQNIVI